MRWLIATLSCIMLACQFQEPEDLNVLVVDPTGKPADGADVWMLVGADTKMHLKTGTDGRFFIAKTVIEPLWKERKYPHITVRDREGRLGSQFRTPWPGNETRDVIKLTPVSEVRGRVVDNDGKPVAGAGRREGIQCRACWFACAGVDPDSSERTSALRRRDRCDWRFRGARRAEESAHDCGNRSVRARTRHDRLGYAHGTDASSSQSDDSQWQTYRGTGWILRRLEVHAGITRCPCAA